MMCLGVYFGPNFFGTLRVPESVFPLPDWGTSPLLFVQISFQFLAIVLLLLAPLYLDIGTFKVVPKVPKPLLIFWNSYFFILF